MKGRFCSLAHDVRFYHRAMNRGQILRNFGRDADWVSGTRLSVSQRVSLRLIRPSEFMSALLHNQHLFQPLHSSRQRQS